MAAAINTWIATANPAAYDTTGNWTDGTPDAGDFIYFQLSPIDVSSGFAQSGVALGSFSTFDTYTGKIGLCNLGTSPAVPGTYLEIDAPVSFIGRCQNPGSQGSGSPRTMLNIGSTTAQTMTVESTCLNSADGALPPVRILGVKTTHVLNVIKGNVGVAVASASEVSTFGTINIGQAGLPDALTKFASGIGLTINTAVNVFSGQAVLGILAGSTLPALNVKGGMVTTIGTNTYTATAVNVYGGIYKPRHVGTNTAVNIFGGKVDLSEAPAAQVNTTITNNVGPDALVKGRFTANIGTLVENFGFKGGSGPSFGA